MISRHMLTGVRTKKLGEIVDFLDHKRKPVKESERIPGPYPYYGANGKQGTINDYIFDEPLVLLAEDGGHFDDPSRGIAYRVEGRSWVNNHAHVLRPRREVDSAYLCRVLENYDVTPWITGSTRAKLTKTGAADIEIPFPMIEEQRRIAAILDKADALRAKRREAIAKINRLLQSVFIEIFGDPVENLKRWPVMTLSEVSQEKMTNGIFRKKEGYSDKGLPVVWVEELFDGLSLDLSKSRMIVPTSKEIDVFSLFPGDILFCRSSLKMDGIAYNNIYLGQEKKALFECHLIRLRVNQDVIDPVFLNYLLRTDGMRARVKRFAKTSTMTTIDQKGLGSVEVIVPDLESQMRFRNFLEKCVDHEKLMRDKENRLENLFLSLQQRAFSGAL